jgi:putative transposase
MVIAKKHRLPAERYHGKINLAITARLIRPRDGFVDPNVVNECVSILTTHATDSHCRVPIYCFMPNHVHMIIRGMADESRARDCMDGFKETTALWFVRNRPRIHWQISYFDHIIRGCEDWRE